MATTITTLDMFGNATETVVHEETSDVVSTVNAALAAKYKFVDFTRVDDGKRMSFTADEISRVEEQ